MVVIRRQITMIIIIVAFVHPVWSKKEKEHNLGYVHGIASQTMDPSDWRVIEALAEEHPYIVALLSSMKYYICTGSVINKKTVVTSGNCVATQPKHVAVSTAVYNRYVNNNTIFNVVSTLVHGDYIFELKTSDPNVTRMHSNVGLVFVDRPFLDLFINVAELGNYYVSELQDKKMTVIGYGSIGSSSLVSLQYQGYQQSSCVNPKWYYCICGIEYTTLYKTYISEFGIGAPVLLGTKLVGIAAAPCGTLTVKNFGIKYNVFTVIGPYLPWMEKSMNAVSTRSELIFRSKGVDVEQSILLKHCHILIMISKILF